MLAVRERIRRLVEAQVVRLVMRALTVAPAQMPAPRARLVSSVLLQHPSNANHAMLAGAVQILAGRHRAQIARLGVLVAVAAGLARRARRGVTKVQPATALAFRVQKACSRCSLAWHRAVAAPPAASRVCMA